MIFIISLLLMSVFGILSVSVTLIVGSIVLGFVMTAVGFVVKILNYIIYPFKWVCNKSR